MDALKWLQQRTKWEGRRMSLIQKQMELFKVLQLATISNVHSMQKNKYKQQTNSSFSDETAMCNIMYFYICHSISWK